MCIWLTVCHVCVFRCGSTAWISGQMSRNTTFSSMQKSSILTLSKRKPRYKVINNMKRYQCKAKAIFLRKLLLHYIYLQRIWTDGLTLLLPLLKKEAITLLGPVHLCKHKIPSTYIWYEDKSFDHLSVYVYIKVEPYLNLVIFITCRVYKMKIKVLIIC